MYRIVQQGVAKVLNHYAGVDPEFIFIRQDAWETNPPEWLLERQYAWEGVREDFLARASRDYEIVLPFEEERWWIVWKKKDEQLQ